MLKINWPKNSETILMYQILNECSHHFTHIFCIFNLMVKHVKNLCKYTAGGKVGIN